MIMIKAQLRHAAKPYADVFETAAADADCRAPLAVLVPVIIPYCMSPSLNAWCMRFRVMPSREHCGGGTAGRSCKLNFQSTKLHLQTQVQTNVRVIERLPCTIGEASR